MIDKSTYLKVADNLYTDELIVKASKIEMLAFDRWCSHRWWLIF